MGDKRLYRSPQMKKARALTEDKQNQWVVLEQCSSFKQAKKRAYDINRKWPHLPSPWAKMRAREVKGNAGEFYVWIKLDPRLPGHRRPKPATKRKAGATKAPKNVDLKGRLTQAIKAIDIAPRVIDDLSDIRDLLSEVIVTLRSVI